MPPPPSTPPAAAGPTAAHPSAADLPYSGAEWQAIAACGDAVESLLKRQGVLLTMGGEPTFVPFRPDGAEWQTSALGPTKLGYARKFAHALIQATSPGAVILETSGKLFPGEVLPRWTLLVQRRADGVPLWQDLGRLRADGEPGTHSAADARRFAEALCTRLGLPPARLLPCVEPAALAAVVGYVLPLDRVGDAWISADWAAAVRAGPTPRSPGSVALIAGDSLLGLRLPLGELAEPTLRRALTVEVKEGALAVFIPPLILESYQILLPVIEACLAALNLRGAVLAGYAPPADPALPTVGLASDPGVIEINLAVCATWAEYDRHLRQIYAAAAAVGLCARKYQLNGRETGTGGGAHLVFGGPVGLTSPFFVFPALLPSVIRYWQHHPALSYAFAGQYLGPSSQAPRIDESTFEALYELEIACEGAARLGTPQNLALFDLMFRDLLMDRSGNTHRAEISVDKLWNPFAGNGRLGLVEFRAFESHPQAPAAAVAALFVRALLARLQADPFTAPFVRWAGELHDRFFLPAFLWRDLVAVCEDLARHGVPFDPEWLRPWWEWRFPKFGEFALKSGTVEFRQALEAWPLLGEQPSGTGTIRCVDSSADRIEAAVDRAALLDEGLLLVNGLPCEFRRAHEGAAPAGGFPGAAAAGIRFRAFYLNACLHPHVAVHAPLLLEWVDRTTLVVLAAARWHVWNPRGESYAARPVTPEEAAARARERWEPWPHTVGQARFIPAVDYPPEGRHTLDLRRYPAQAR
jgi:uncharacterized protein (DUF2126 family)